MSGTLAIQPLSRRDPAVARVVHDWRRLTSGRDERRVGRGEATLVACSGGADSTALLLALASATRALVVGHVVHDLRPRADVEADRDAVRALAAALELPFLSAEVRVAGFPGNAEGHARGARYQALAELAERAGVSFVATAHQADDQLETILMRLLRGAGPSGLRGVLRRRMLREDPPVIVVRPMLGVDRSASEKLCRAAGVAWRTDATNTDLSRTRNRLRAEVVPRLRALRGDVAHRAVNLGEVFQDVTSLIRDDVDEIWPQACRLPAAGGCGPGLAWRRTMLAARPTLVLGEIVRRAKDRLARGVGRDRLGSAQLGPIVRAVQDQCNDPRYFELPGVIVRVTSHAVEIRRR